MNTLIAVNSRKEYQVNTSLQTPHIHAHTSTGTLQNKTKKRDECHIHHFKLEVNFWVYNLIFNPSLQTFSAIQKESKHGLLSSLQII